MAASRKEASLTGTDHCGRKPMVLRAMLGMGVSMMVVLFVGFAGAIIASISEEAAAAGSHVEP